MAFPSEILSIRSCDTTTTPKKGKIGLKNNSHPSHYFLHVDDVCTLSGVIFTQIKFHG